MSVCMANLEALNEVRDWLAIYDKFWSASLRHLDRSSQQIPDATC